MNILQQIPFNRMQAVVFDIDDTLIDSQTHRIMPKVFALYRYCIDRGYNVYIITARAKGGLNYTINQLDNYGITGYKNITFRHPDDYNVTQYKLNARKSIPETVVMSVGDQPWDIGAFGGVGLIVR
jgi:phosphoglycolate phosphatase-like HAD superfamily hydrolase